MIIVEDKAIELKKEFKSLTDYEALRIACMLAHNNILEAAYCISSQAPSAFEKIAMELERIADKDFIIQIVKEEE